MARRNKYRSKWMTMTETDASGRWHIVYRLKDGRKGDQPGNRCEWGRYSSYGEAVRTAEVMNMAEEIQSKPPLKRPKNCRCGGRAEVTKCYDAAEGRTLYGIMCRTCSITLPAEYEDREKAVRVWNRNISRTPVKEGRH